MLTDIEIMRTGTFTASNGKDVTFNEDDLTRIAESFDPSFHEAPVTIGHPVDNKPAYGWVKSLKSAGGKLMASLDLVPEFMETVRQGLFKKRSASIYPNLDGKGPYLRHVAFLGAMPPAIKALTDIQLNDEGQEVLIIDFSDKEERKMSWKDLFKKAVDEMPDQPETQIVPQTTQAVSFSEEDVKKREEEAARKAREEARKEAELEFSEQIKKSEAEKAEALRKVEVKNRLEALTKEGKVLPAWMKAGLVDFACSLSGSDDSRFEFSEGNKQSPSEWFMGFLGELPQLVELGEIAGRETDPGPGQGGAAKKLDDLVREKLKGTPGMTFSMAFSEVQREHPALAIEYQAEISG